MSCVNDFVISDGVLTKYYGLGGEIVIPDGITIIGWYAFKGRKDINKSRFRRDYRKSNHVPLKIVGVVIIGG